MLNMFDLEVILSILFIHNEEAVDINYFEKGPDYDSPTAGNEYF